MEYGDIQKIIGYMENSNLDSLDIEFPDGMKISMKKSQDTGDKRIEKTVVQEDGEKVVLVQETKKVGAKIIKSPMVGTFYSSSSPNNPPLVNLGDKVKKGDTLCIIEAMKLMNEIESEYDGTIVEILANNEDMVEYGSELFRIE